VVTTGPPPQPEPEADAVALAAVAPAAAKVSATQQAAASMARHERIVFMIVTPSRICGPPQVEIALATP
jgi:hypothetical protein